MKNQLMKIAGSLTILVVLIVSGCQKDSTTTTPAAIVTVSQPGDYNSSEGSIMIGDRTFEDLNGFTDGYITASGLKSAELGSCPLITSTANTSFPILITLDWGTGCTSTVDGVARKGKVNVSLSGLMTVVNSVATVTFSDFVSDGNKITGNHKITYKGPNPGNNWPRYSVLTEAKITFPDGKSISYHAEYTRLQSEGANTLTTADDVWRIEGNARGVSREGVAWTASYPSALIKKASCKWFSGGSVLITPANEKPRTINFGDGTTCDNKATLRINDVTTNIEL